jgi:hypothetical protein
MGLDMHLYRKEYVGHWDEDEQVTLVRNGVEDPRFPKGSIKYVIVEVAYWRKANAIHGWFVDNVQGGVDECHPSQEFGNEVLQQLVDLCKEVLAHPEQAESRLETRSGFFFGSTEYDEYFFEDVRNTIEMLEQVIADNPHGTYYYRSSW